MGRRVLYVVDDIIIFINIITLDIRSNQQKTMIFRHIFTIILTIILTVTLAIVSGYSANAAAHVDGIHKAHSLLIASSVIGWISIALTIAAFVAMIVFGEEILISPWLRMLATSWIYFILLSLLVVGVLMANASSIIHKDKLYGANKNAYTLALNGSLVAIVLSSTLILTFLAVKAYTYYKGHHGDMRRPSHDTHNAMYSKSSFLSNIGKAGAMMDKYI
jgi:hypothetical protein